jgi:hypothetical protein
MKFPLRALIGLAILAPVTAAAVGQPAVATAPSPKPKSVLYLWAGDKGDGPIINGKDFDQPDDNDFLAVVDADASSATYGKVLKTVSVTTAGVGNEPHHMQPFTPKACDRLFGGSLFSDFWWTFNIQDPLNPQQDGTITPADSPGFVPDAAFVLPNCEALGTEMGGDYSTGSYMGGPHGTVIRMSADGTSVLESQLADRVPIDAACESQWNPTPDRGKPGGPFTRKTSVDDCLPSNPHGIWARPDLGELVTSDYATPAQLITPLTANSSVAGLTVRHYKLDEACLTEEPTPAGVDCIGDPRVVLLPDGPRNESNEGHEENVGVMETAATNASGALNPTGVTPKGFLESKGAFATTMCGGVLYYAPDITADSPEWREVYDFTAAGQSVAPSNKGNNVTSGCAGGGAVTVSPDNRYVVHSIVGREPGQAGTLTSPTTNSSGFPGMLVKLDISRLIAAGSGTTCTIDTTKEVWTGGSEKDCPKLSAVHVVDDRSSGGPHFFSFDYPNWNSGVHRLSYFNYFVTETGVGGDDRVCMLKFDDFSLDGAFPAAVDGQNPGSGCVAFNRGDWPDDRGAQAGPAKPHYGIFENTDR